MPFPLVSMSDELISPLCLLGLLSTTELAVEIGGFRTEMLASLEFGWGKQRSLSVLQLQGGKAYQI